MGSKIEYFRAVESWIHVGGVPTEPVRMDDGTQAYHVEVLDNDGDAWPLSGRLSLWDAESNADLINRAVAYWIGRRR